HKPPDTTVVAVPQFMDPAPFKTCPEAILDRKMVKRGRIAATKVLVK
ncbi:hypothetical protein A2U01_0108292, partial [Trifolium medium]|nr:hypothetical protein [Trifolium medium]